MNAMDTTDSVLGVRHTRPGALPPGACDCHTHVFGPGYAFDGARTYTPPEASLDALRAHQRILGLDRVVVVQPSVYGTDNRCTLDAVDALGAAARAVAVIAPGLPRAALRELHSAGVRGVRVNLETAGLHDPAVAARRLRDAADQVSPLGWHVQVFTNLGVIAALHGMLTSLPVPLVIDHFAHASAAAGPGQPGFAALLDLVRNGHAYVKLSAPNRIAEDPADAAPLAHALLAANPARMLWGSDWPHPGARPVNAHGSAPGNAPGNAHDPKAIEPLDPIDDGQALERLRAWTGDAWHAVLVDNPARLYGFP